MTSDRDLQPTLQGVSTALRLLRLMADHSHLGVREAARLLDITPTAAQRLLRTLDAERYLTRSGSDKTYSLSPLVVEIASAYIRRHDFVSLARHSMSTLHAATQETVALYTAYDGTRLCLAEIASPHALRMVAQTGSVRTIANGSTDLVFRAFSSQDDVARMDARVAENGSDHLPSVEEVDRVRADGWAASFGARVAGSAAISAPVATPDGLYVLSVFGPLDRMAEVGMDHVERLTTTTARELESILPWVSGPAAEAGGPS